MAELAIVPLFYSYFANTEFLCQFFGQYFAQFHKEIQSELAGASIVVGETLSSMSTVRS